MKDLFGEEIFEPVHNSVKGYAAAPGSGPKNQTCRTCRHYRSVLYHDKRWRKCALLQGQWTHGPGTDIKAKSPACRWWTWPEIDGNKIDLFRPKTATRRLPY